MLKLARLNVAGGNIRNIALNAAFLAADMGEPVQMSPFAAHCAHRVQQDRKTGHRRGDRRLGMNRAETTCAISGRFCRGGTPWPPPVRNTPSSPEGRPRSAAPTIARESHNKSISLHINELVLHGFPVQERHAVGDATQWNSRDSLVQRAAGLRRECKQTDAIDGGSFHVTPQAKPNAVGSLIAKAVYGGRQ